MRRTRLGIVASILSSACVLLTACESPRTNTPTPSAVNSPVETEREKAHRLAFDGAEAGYRSNMKAQDTLYSGSGKNPNFNDLRKYATGDYLEIIEDDIRALRVKGWRSTKPTKIVGVAREAASDNRVNLKSCEDNSKVKLVNASGEDVTPNLIRRYVQTLVVIKIGADWKVSETTSLKVDSFSDQDCGAQ